MAANAAPQNSALGTQIAHSNSDDALFGLGVFDPDAGSGVLTTTLSVVYGAITVGTSGGATICGNGTSMVALTGTLSQINAALGAPDNVTYRAGSDFFGTDTLTMTTTDNGNTGDGGAQSDTDQAPIIVKPTFIGTPTDDAYLAPAGTGLVEGGAGTDTAAFEFKLTDATVTYVGNTVIIDGPWSHTVLRGVEKFVFTDGVVNNSDGDWLVDDLFYYSQNHDVWNAHLEADAHYHTSGWRQGRDPSAFFSTETYLSLNVDVKAAGVDPLLHFDQFGWSEGRRGSSVTFDAAAYLAANADVAAAHVDPLAHFLQQGAGEGRQAFAPSELIAVNGFDYVYYLEHNRDVAAAGVDAYEHFQTYGWKEGRNPNAWFDTTGYLATYADVADAHVNPLDHYHEYGWREGRDPSLDFDTADYMAANPDVAAARLDPLVHFLTLGAQEGRVAFFDAAWA